MIDLKQYGYIETEAPPNDLLPGRVTAVYRERYQQQRKRDRQKIREKYSKRKSGEAYIERKQR